MACEPSCLLKPCRKDDVTTKECISQISKSVDIPISIGRKKYSNIQKSTGFGIFVIVQSRKFWQSEMERLRELKEFPNRLPLFIEL